MLAVCSSGFRLLGAGLRLAGLGLLRLLLVCLRRLPQEDVSRCDVGRYSQKLQRLLGLPEDGQGIPFGSFLPCDIPSAVEELGKQRIKDLNLIGNDPALSGRTTALIHGRKFHTFDDFKLELKQRSPGRKDFIGFGSSMERGNPDLQSYLEHIRSHDPGFADFLEKPQPAAIATEAFDTSVYVTGETKSGKSYLAETLAFLLASDPKAGVWVLDPHGSLARSCAEWKSNLGRETFYFDVNIGEGQLPKFNPFDQLPDNSAATLDIVTQEQVNAFSVIAGASAMTDNMRNLLASSIHLMLASPSGSMQELFRLMDDARNEDLVAAGQQLANPFHREFFLHEFGKKSLKATKAAISTRLAGLLSSSALYGITQGKSTFHIPTAFNRPGCYIFNFGKGVIGETASTMFGRLVLAQLQASAFKRERDGLTEKKVPTKNYVLIDECHNFVNHTTGTIVAEARKYGLSLILVQQFAGQEIEAGLFKNIMTNTPLKFTGVGTAGTYEQVAQSQQAERESFYGLKPRRFHVSKRGAFPFIASASSLLASRQERMTHEEWRGFIDGQLTRWYGSGDAKGVQVVSVADPEEYAHERPLKSPVGAIPVPVAHPPASATIGSVLAVMRRKLTGESPKPPDPTPASFPSANSQELSDTNVTHKPPQGDYEPETEISPGVFHARKKRSKFPRP